MEQLLGVPCARRIPGPGADGRRASPRVLVVDDHDLNLKLLQRVLELDGHEVIPADSMAAAERAIAAERPALIVLDLHLPDGDGLDLARRLKSSPRNANGARSSPALPAP